MNPAIVAPDAFDIVDVTVDKGLTVEQVLSLGLLKLETFFCPLLYKEFWSYIRCTT